MQLLLRKQYLTIAACALMLWGCAANDTADEPSPLVTFAPEASFSTVWETGTGVGSKKLELHLEPYFGIEQIYIADIKGRVTAVKKSNGAVLWSVETEYPVSGGLGGTAGYLFFGTRDGRLVALRREDGSVAWVTELTSESLVVPAAEAGIVVTRTVDGNILAFNQLTGEKLWSYSQSVPSLSLRGNSDPVIYRGGVLAGSDNGRLTALALNNGRLLQETPIAIPSGSSELSRLVDVDSKIIIDKGFIYAAAFQGRVVCLSLEAAQAVWARDMSIYRDMTLDGENLYLSDEDGHVWALNAMTGATVWVQDKLHARPITGPVVYRDAVLVADFEGYVHAMHVTDGRFIARTQIGSEDIKVEPVVNDDKVFVLTRKGTLAALTLNRLELVKTNPNPNADANADEE